MDSLKQNLFKHRFSILLALVAALPALTALEKRPSIIFLALLLPLILAVLYLERRIAKFESSLRASENKFRILFESANDCLMVLDLKGCILDINHTGCERLGYTKPEMVGKSISQFVAPEFAAKVPDRFSEVRNKGQVIFESMHLSKDGSAIPIEVNARVVDLNGAPQILSVVRDITERKRMDSVMREREAQYRAVIETAADGFWITDMQGRFLEVNDAYVRLSGYSRGELMTMCISDVEAVERPVDTSAHINKVLKEGHDRFESYHRTRAGKILPVEVVASYWPIGDGRLFVFVVDITRRKQMERYTQESEKRYRSLFENLLDGFALFKLSMHDGQMP
ncbi:MAG TPA: PAS domain S-box protein, partial [Candidatus Paceibacterota bacterium]